jgi:CheY-like chemotaxis protein
MNILIVDDSPINRSLMEALFKNIVRESVTFAEDGQQAVDAYIKLRKEKELVVILIDINMPIMNGIESIKMVRQYEDDNNMSPAQIIVVTGYDTANAEYLAKMVGANAFLPKPLKKADMVKELKKLVGEENVISTEK